MIFVCAMYVLVGTPTMLRQYALKKKKNMFKKKTKMVLAFKYRNILNHTRAGVKISSDV